MPGYTLTQLETLEAAIAQGARRVKYGDKEVEYQSLAEMQALRARMRLELGLEQVSQAVFPTFSKGL